MMLVIKIVFGILVVAIIGVSFCYAFRHVITKLRGV